MPVFHEIRLRDDVEQGAQGGPGFLTVIQELSSGHEQRNVSWQKARGRWNLSYGIESVAQLQEINTFFLCRRGRAYGFRFKDWLDFTMVRQSIGTGDGADATWQLFKRYTDPSPAALHYDRTLAKIVTGTVQVWVANNLKTEGVHYTVDYNTGIITFTGGNIPTAGQNIEAACQFDVPVRFDSDQFNVSVQTFLAGSIPALNIVEVRVA